jgi:hypothetical protein
VRSEEATVRATIARLVVEETALGAVEIRRPEPTA